MTWNKLTREEKIEILEKQLDQVRSDRVIYKAQEDIPPQLQKKLFEWMDSVERICIKKLKELGIDDK